jgi:predicted dehydrogenase
MTNNYSLIIGMGFGQAVYKPVLESLGRQVVTVDADPAKGADFTTVQQAIATHSHFGTVNICTPNFTHESIAREVGNAADIVFVEKPGVKDSATWQKLVNDFPQTSFMMVKNNQYRDEMRLFKDQADQSLRAYVRWNNANRIPHPGSWFTTKDKAFGGVSRDLMPHMLSYYCALTDYKNGITEKASVHQLNQLKDIHDTDYGVVNPDGTYDVDDFCHFEFKNGNTTWILTANWKTNLDHDDSSISFNGNSFAMRHELGLCPEDAYRRMIKTAMDNINNENFWQDQYEQDMWIHKQIENL